MSFRLHGKSRRSACLDVLFWFGIGCVENDVTDRLEPKCSSSESKAIWAVRSGIASYECAFLSGSMPWQKWTHLQHIHDAIKYQKKFHKITKNSGLNVELTHFLCLYFSVFLYFHAGVRKLRSWAIALFCCIWLGCVFRTRFFTDPRLWDVTRLSPAVANCLIEHFLFYISNIEHFSSKDVGEDVGAAPEHCVSG